MLKIVKPSDPIEVKTINLSIYGGPGLGKTSLAQTAEDPITLDFDAGIERAAIRKDVVLVSKWDDVASINASDVEKFKTVVVDTAGRAIDALTVDIIARNPKLGRAGALTLQGFGELKSKFIAWMKLLNSFGKDVVLVAHLEEQRSGDDVIERLDIAGGSKGEIYKSSDAMGRILIDSQLRRSIDFSPRPNAFGKDPARLGVVPFPDPLAEADTLAKLIKTIKQHLNRLSEEQREMQSVVAEWAEALAAYRHPDDFNEVLDQLKKAPQSVQSLAKKRVQELGLGWKKGLVVASEETAITA